MSKLRKIKSILKPSSKNKIVAVVKFNDREAYVLKKPIKLTYKKYDDIIIGTDGCFIEAYYFEIDNHAKAFAGRKFTLPLDNGDIVNCDGQWWYGLTKKSQKIIEKQTVGATVSDIETLRNCYVYSGYSAIKDSLKGLRDKYKGKVYEYYEYDKLIKEQFDGK